MGVVHLYKSLCRTDFVNRECKADYVELILNIWENPVNKGFLGDYTERTL